MVLAAFAGGEVGRDAGRPGDVNGGADETCGDVGGVIERGVGSDGIDEVEAGPGEGAGGAGVCGAVEIGEGGEADEDGQRDPVASGSVRGDGAKTERTEGGGAEGLERVEGAEEGMGVLEDEGSGGDAERGAEGVVGVGDLDLAGAGEGGG